MKIPFLTALAAAVVLTTLLPIQQASASDRKNYAGSGCKVFGSTAWTDLQFGARGITNLSAAPKNIICPIVKDSEGQWDGAHTTPTNAATVNLWLKAGPNTQKTTCNVYIVNATGTLQNTYSNQTTGTPNIYDTMVLGPFDSVYVGSQQHATMLCTLAPGARLNYYYVTEPGNTDS